MSRFRTVVVEDEPLARSMVVDLLERDREVELVAACGDGRSALATLRHERPDIAFLDVEMPEMGGIEVAASLEAEALPAIVFVTAYPRYAVEAFRVHALDYVVKPFSDERFLAALEVAKGRVRERRLSDLAVRISALSSELERRPPPIPSDRLSIREGGRTRIVPTDDIVWIESQDYYARIHTRADRHLVRASLSSLADQLDPSRFVRIHRTAIANVDAIREVRRRPRGARIAVMNDGTELRVSRPRVRDLERLLEPARTRRSR